MLAGYLGGPLDGLIRNTVDIGLTIPPLAILIMIAASFSVVTPLMMGLVIAATSWMHPTRVIRSQVLSLREREFVLLLRLSGASPLHIIFPRIAAEPDSHSWPPLSSIRVADGHPRFDRPGSAGPRLV